MINFYFRGWQGRLGTIIIVFPKLCLIVFPKLASKPRNSIGCYVCPFLLLLCICLYLPSPIADWKDAQNRRNFFERYGAENGFDPLISGNWYSHQRESIMAFYGI